MTTLSLVARMGPVCRDKQRRAGILAHPTLNGIDFVEYERRPLSPTPFVLVVTFLKPLPGPGADGAYDLTAHPELVVVDGGARVRPVRVVKVTRAADKLEIAVDQEGDFSIYYVALGWRLEPDGNWQSVIPELDPIYSLAPVYFKANCPVDFDCRQIQDCPPPEDPEPSIDYLSKDYSSFRKLLLDQIPLLNPDWLERNPADLGIMLVELLAYTGDRLSYFQDAVANEAYLDTARQRVSVRRHARLVDYVINDGRAAWGYVHARVNGTGTIPDRTKVLTRITSPLRHQHDVPAVVIPDALLPPQAFDQDPALGGVRVFESKAAIDVNDLNNELWIHDWGNLECCAGRGTQSVYLYSPGPASGGVRIARMPALTAGDYLLIEEVLGPSTGAPADADPSHRQVVRLTSVETASDPVYNDHVHSDGALQVFGAGDTPLPMAHVSWEAVDALTFPVCLSTQPPGRPPLKNVSVARGNIIPVDHGRTVQDVAVFDPPVSGETAFRLTLAQAPLTMLPDPAMLNVDIDFPEGTEPWSVVPDLLESDSFSRDYTVEVDNSGRATLRFGDDEYGRSPTGATKFTITYRIGNGRDGNVGPEAMAHIVQPPVAPAWPNTSLVRNPLPSRDGTDPETIAHARQMAPAAFHAEQFRAVTEADYATAASKLASVAGAVATFRWTGSWHTVFVGVDPRNPADLITEPGGRTLISPGLEREVRAFLTGYKLAGYDLEIRSAQYVPLDIAMELCVLAEYFRADVVQAVLSALKRFFDPANFTFAQPVYLSRLYAAVEAVQGVDSVFFTKFQRFGKVANHELETGILPLGPWEIARLDNDPDFMENGVIHSTAGGGK